jgi:hypothetical protein
MLRSLVAKETASIDGFGTAFFSAFGMEAALRFVDGLPLGDSTTISLFWFSSIQIAALFIVTPLVVFCFAALTSCGGGLLKDVLLEAIVLRKVSPWSTLRSWPWKGTTQCAAGIGLMSYGGYLAVTPDAGHLGNCLQIAPAHMAQIVVICGILGFVIWGGVYRPRSA